MDKSIMLFRAFAVALALMLTFINIGQAAPENDSSQQAIAQLRLLQDRLSKSYEGGEANGQAGGAKVTQGTTVVTQTQLPRPPVPQPPPASSDTSAQALAILGSNSPEALVLTPSDHELIQAKAFEGVTKQLFPLSTDEIIKLKQLSQKVEAASVATPGTPPKPTATSQFVNLSPGSTPPVIRLAQGFVSSLVFLDSTGAPWPISAYDLGDPGAFNIQWDKTSNTLMIQAQKLYNYGNLAVRLKGLNTPVMLTLIPGQHAVDYRVDLRVQGYGPNASTAPLEEGIPPSASDILLHILDGVPPDGSQRLTVTGGDARAWFVNDKMYVRTNLTMQKAPVLLISWHGKVMQLKVEGL